MEFTLKADTRFSGSCPDCRKWCVYRPLAPRGRSRAYAPQLEQMGVTCGRCGARVTLDADCGQSIRQPWIMTEDELMAAVREAGVLNAHLAEHHNGGKSRIRGRSAGRTLRERASWHWNAHHRQHQGHHHFGPFVLVLRNGSTVGQIPRPLGWFTGGEVKTRAQVAAEWREKHPAGEGR